MRLSRLSLRNLSWFCTALAFVVVGMGAFTRLVDAGLGCPDWPGCYGQWTVPDDSGQLSGLEPFKAWVEMVHRYFAGGLGLSILILAWRLWRRRHHEGCPWKHGALLLGLVIVQALFGMWTVTLKLWPQVVTLHLLGGMATLAGLYLLSVRLSQPPCGAERRHLRPLYQFACLGGLLLIVQIGLGGWTSANYAALACPDFPTCQQRWWPDMSVSGGFSAQRPSGESYLGGQRLPQARIAIHMVHRVGASVVMLFWGGLCLWLLLKYQHLRRYSLTVLMLLAAQLGIGIANVLLQLPLQLALAHNLGAACLLLAVLRLLFELRRPKEVGNV